MNTLNHDSTSAVNPLTLKPKLLSTYLLIRDLAKRHGYCYAGNQALAGMLGVSVDTVTRRVKALAGFGLLSVEQQPGLRRLLFVCRLPKICRRFADTPHESSIYAKKATDKPAPTEPSAAAPDALVDDLCAQGVSLSAARTLAAAYKDRCLAWLQIPEVWKKARNPAAYLRVLIERGAEPPAKAPQERRRTLKLKPEASSPPEVMPLDRQALARGLGGYVRLRHA